MKGKAGKNVVQFRRGWGPYGSGDVAGFDGVTTKLLLEDGYAVLLGEDTADPVPEDRDIDAEPDNLAEAVRKRLRGRGEESHIPQMTTEEMLEEGELRWWSDIL